ncbi:DUF2842 domain-containing protein [Aquicoccus sp. G2-2]|uniref:DUF2842 domain-containing protein n=1 Tax=Aquicoccus sp. G2-2 TaxID=3092120 RepID=UPI002AE006A9|nr:DUF2842 domain-containing protein [Aquicoccus sp. G2-2]MEA1112746.1 DUF2842 domain-containing protein [Aquicoccus sp. G2-2]
MWERFSYKARKRLSILVLLVGMPIYIVLAVTLVDRLDRPSVLIELLIYVALGIAWIVPFKGLFKGIGQPDPDAGPGKDD